MKYLSIAQTAERWGISTRRIQILCGEGATFGKRSLLLMDVTPGPIPGPTVLTPASSLASYIIPTDQHESFMRTLSSLMRT